MREWGRIYVNYTYSYRMFPLLARKGPHQQRMATVHFMTSSGHTAMAASGSVKNGMTSSDDGTQNTSLPLRRRGPLLPVNLNSADLPTYLENPTYVATNFLKKWTRGNTPPHLRWTTTQREGGPPSPPPPSPEPEETPEEMEWEAEEEALATPLPLTPLLPPRPAEQMEPMDLSVRPLDLSFRPLPEIPASADTAEEGEGEYMSMEGLYLEILPDAPVPPPPPVLPELNIVSPVSPFTSLILRDLQRIHMDPVLQRDQTLREARRLARKARSTQRRQKKLGRALILMTSLAALTASSLMLYTLIKHLLRS